MPTRRTVTTAEPKTISRLRDAVGALGSFLDRNGLGLSSLIVCALLALSATGVAAHGASATLGVQPKSQDVAEEASAASVEGVDAEPSSGIDVTVNGSALALPEGASVLAAAEAAGVALSPGNLVAVDGSIIEEGGGGQPSVSVNGRDAGLDTPLASGDVVLATPGANETEPSRETRMPAATSVYRDDTIGSIHQIVGDEGTAERVLATGEVSGIEVERETDGVPGPAHLTHFSVRPTEKVVALTFDDGPWGDTTAQLLDLLAEHDAHATFFVVGTCFDGDDDACALVKREHDEGHQVCTHTYTHAAGAKGFRMSELGSYEQIQEVSRGQDAIAAATGQAASRVVRMPGGSYGEDVAFNVMPYVSYEIGWDVDSLDWRRPGTDAIEEALGKAEPGDVVLMHDGGGDRTQTVEALRTMLPKMKKDGWRFVTIDELLALDGAMRDAYAEPKPSVALPEDEPAAEGDAGTEGGALDEAGAGAPSSDDATAYSYVPDYGYGYGSDYGVGGDYGYGYGTDYEYGSDLGYGYDTTEQGFDWTSIGYGTTYSTTTDSTGSMYDSWGTYSETAW